MKDKERAGQEQCSTLKILSRVDGCFHCLDDAGTFIHYTYVSPREIVHLNVHILVCQLYLNKRICKKSQQNLSRL